MSTTKRVFVAVGAPLVLAVGLAVVWGVRGAIRLKAQIEAVADSLQHSPDPVHIRVPIVPVYLDGAHIGRLDEVVVQRHEAATVDSLRLVIGTGDRADLAKLAACRVHLDPDAFDRNGPLGVRDALTCADDTSDLVRFGTVRFVGDGTAETSALYLSRSDLPCSHMSNPATGGCTEIGPEIDQLRQRLRDQADRLRFEIRNSVRQNVKVTVGSDSGS